MFSGSREKVNWEQMGQFVLTSVKHQEKSVKLYVEMCTVSAK